MLIRGVCDVCIDSVVDVVVVGVVVVDVVVVVADGVTCRDVLLIVGGVVVFGSGVCSYEHVVWGVVCVGLNWSCGGWWGVCECCGCIGGCEWCVLCCCC